MIIYSKVPFLDLDTLQIAITVDVVVNIIIVIL